MIITVYKYLTNTAPFSLRELLKICESNYNFRGQQILRLPNVQATKYGLKSCRYNAAKEWNSLTNEIANLPVKRVP